MLIKNIITLIICSLLLACISNRTDITMGEKITISVNTNSERKSISPYIYGVNDFVASQNVTVFSVRQGGNRLSAYNWENNFSNAGSDWQHYSDTYLSTSKSPAAIALQMADNAKRKNIPYMITTLQMAGFVSADGLLAVSQKETAPSRRFKEVVFKKNAPFSNTPDLDDNYVYMDEYVNYIVQKLGQGVMHYNLDNEPALWSHTHPRVHPEKTLALEIVEKSAALSASVKAVDPKAEIHAPSLYGVGAYNDFHSPSDWDAIKRSKNYDWFISYYLDAMSAKSKEAGIRLLDSLDVHFYSEARGDCRVTECNNASHSACVKARLQAARSLWQEGYIEDSWVGKYLSHVLPVINKLNQSIDKYYPGTKISLTEYNFGGGSQISGAIAQADALGIFGKTGVYMASLWPLADNCRYQLSAINLFTNYDGAFSSFGNTSVFARTSSIEDSYVYAAVKESNESSRPAEKVTVIAANKSINNYHEMEFNIESSFRYSSVTPYIISEGSYEIKKGETIPVKNNTFIFRMPPLSAALFAVE